MDTPYVFEWIEETTSTQDEARRLFDGSPVVIAAARQTRGRGRNDRTWENAPRAIAVSVCWAPGWEPSTFGRLPLVAGLAATDVIDARLKWPNDLVNAAGHKVGGILAEAVGPVVTIGFGLNLYWPEPPDGYGAVYREDPGRCESLAAAFGSQLLMRADAGSEHWDRAAYLERCVTIDNLITWRPGGAGRAVGVGQGGELMVETSDGIRSLVTGEVWEVRSSPS
ncbi:MAG: biotin--[acetyl-CoA-carboxylase] ligase [Acidimicrobiia bacterium]|nr:biotin--[acetyl-CoA-carboxylase] ligase [Acidimicrobiia bacterium]